MQIFGSPLRPKAAAEAQSISVGHLARLRRDGELKEGIHYRCIAYQTYRYHSDAIENFFLNRQDPDEHLRWIQQRLLKQRKL
jgi:hypothetical protein